METSAEGGRPLPSTKRLGVLGTLVWDTIRSPTHDVELEDWGGIAYSFAALEGALPAGWEVVPLLKVGRDMEDAAFSYLEGLGCVSDLGAVTVVPEANNRVELMKSRDGRRTEHLTGGVPGWSWTELEPHKDRLDALYVNFISGFEMTLDDAGQLPLGFPGPVHADLHSLFLGVEPGSGRRIHRPLPDASRWVRCFDSVQMNEDEFGLFCEGREDPWKWVGTVVGGIPKMVVVTLGPEGSVGLASESAGGALETWRASRQAVGTGSSRFERAPSEKSRTVGDTIGCGDVWGATFFGSFLGSGEFRGSMVRANEMAKRKLTTQGSLALLQDIRGGVSIPVDSRPGSVSK